jgi:hypothetical protein
VHRFTRSLKTTLVAVAGVVTALAVARLTQAASDGTDRASTSTTKTASTTTTKTTTAPPVKSGPKATTKKVTCKASLIAVVTPIDRAEHFGILRCSSPFGKGVQHDSSKITRTSETAGSLTGSIKLFLDSGTLRGSVKMTLAAKEGKAAYEGTMKVSAGTGQYAGVKGSGTITGTSADLVRTPVTEKLTLTIPPAKK